MTTFTGDFLASDEASFDELVESIKIGKHPAYGTLTWDGETRQTAFSVQFQHSPSDDPDMVRVRAWRFLKQLKPNERRFLQIEIYIKGRVPIYAIIRPRDGAAGVLRLGTARLQALEKAANHR